VVKNITIPAHELPAALEQGIWFDGSSIEGFARVADSDMHLRPDISTYAIVPWLTGDDATARLICDVYTPEGQPFQGDPRGVLRKALEAAGDMGFSYFTGPELEFFLFKSNDGCAPEIPNPHDGAVILTRLRICIRLTPSNDHRAGGIRVEGGSHAP
jgi:glutamine synthetase